VTGELEVFEIDYEDGRHERQYFLISTDAKKEKYKLHFSKEDSIILSGSKVRAKGVALEENIVLAAGGEDTGLDEIIPGETVFEGEQKTIVIIADFLDADTTCSYSSIQDLMFTDPNDKSVDDYYQETSHGNINFSGDVYGPYTINFNSTGSCSYYSWGYALDTIAQDNGVDLSQYNRKIYVIPNQNSCGGWAGLGSIGGNPSRTWIFTCHLADVYAHELGHNIGMHHSSTPPSCEYCDTSCIMGYGGVGLRQLNAPHKDQMGWMPQDQFINIEDDGIFNLAPLEVDPSSAQYNQIIKFDRESDSDYYYLSYRRPIGFDASHLPSKYREKLAVHTYKGYGAYKSYLYDYLVDGESYVDETNGITVTQVAHNNDYVTVQVDFEGPQVL